MKAFLLVSLMVTSNLFASEVLDLDRCFKPAKKFYNQNRQASDIPIRFEKSQLLLAGTELLNLQKKPIAKYDSDKLVYVGNGSYYSGWLTDLIIVDPVLCNGEAILNIYSE